MDRPSHCVLLGQIRARRVSCSNTVFCNCEMGFLSTIALYLVFVVSAVPLNNQLVPEVSDLYHCVLYLHLHKGFRHIEVLPLFWLFGGPK